MTNKTTFTAQQQQVIDILRAKLTRGQRIDFTRNLNKKGFDTAVELAKKRITLTITLGYKLEDGTRSL